jgi:hypothetical protein
MVSPVPAARRERLTTNDQRAAGALVWEFGRACELIGQMLTSFGVR